MSDSHSSKRNASRIRFDTFFPTVEEIFRDVPPKIGYPFTFTPSPLPDNSLLFNVWYFGGEHQFTRRCFQICRVGGVVRHSCISTAVDASDLQAANETVEQFRKYSFPFHSKSMERLDLKNKNSPGITPDNDKYVVLLKLICITWESYFPAPTLLEPYIYDNMDPRVTNLLKLTQTRPAARSALGFNPKIWQRLSIVFREGIISLMQSSFPQANSISPTINGTSSALISANFISLIKNIDRLNDLCTIARNMLATNELAQDLAAMAKFEKQIMMLIDTCVRVTARGYDGPIDGGDRQSQEKWQKVVAAYKKLLITCLQFLHNFIMHNENRKLGLWMDLFSHSMSSDPSFVQNSLDNSRQRTFENDDLPNGAADFDEGKLNRDVDAIANEIKKFGLPSGKAPSPNMAADLDEAKAPSSDQGLLSDTLMGQDRCAGLGNNAADKVINTAKSPEIVNIVKNAGKLPAMEDMEIRPASEAASNLENAKQRLMERIRDNSQIHLGEEHDGNAYDSRDDTGHDEISDANAEDGDEDEDDDDDREESYRGPGDQERGLLTDIPLVLAPTEIEALPMILQAGIVPHFGDKTMQNARCNILLAQESGRNLLRELLIFIAAWDLPDEEIYFRLMQQIMQAILGNGLMPLAYTSFGEAKDIISPAQAVMLKILTQIFRARHSSQDAESLATNMHDASTGLNADSTLSLLQQSPSCFDTTIIKFIFSVFRQTVIPQTCALIFLQGQIRGGQATPEDFPLNLWDMERVYEGVYQFLEFFAVLAEDPAWKKLLVEWEIVHELVALLKELESGIPKASLDKSGQRDATSLANPPISMQQSTQAIVERPYDPATSENSATAETHDGEEDDGQGILSAENPEDFEWRNLKKLVVLVLSSLVWKSAEVQNQVRENGGVEAILGCCSYDGNNPYIREHAIMCLRFLLEANADNQQIVRKLEARQVVPSEVLDKRAYETFIDLNGRVGLRRKGSAPMVS